MKRAWKGDRTFQEWFDGRELRVFSRLDTPAKIQAFLDDLPYSPEERYRCPRAVLRDRTAHCYDGAVFAAAALRRLGHPPLLLDLLADNDDEHLLALYRRGGHWGAVAKSNFVGLRLREPVYRTIRELVMSYFELYYNVRGEKTLRSYLGPLNLTAFDRMGWMVNDEPMDAIALKLETMRLKRLVTEEMVAHLSPVDRRSYQAGLMGANPAGLYRPNKQRATG
jgi:hypothetical protein